MRRSMLTNNTYPIILDDFSSGTLSKWLGSSRFTTSAGKMDYVTSTGSYINPDTIWYGYRTMARGEIVSVDCNRSVAGGPAEYMGLVLHGITNTPSGNYPIDTGYLAVADGTTLLIQYVSSGSFTTLGSASFPSTYQNFSLRAYVNPLSHPTDPGKFYVEALFNGFFVTSVTATVTSGYDFNGLLGVYGTAASKSSVETLSYDNVKVEGRT